jgi:hypothetical protein
MIGALAQKLKAARLVASGVQTVAVMAKTVEEPFEGLIAPVLQVVAVRVVGSSFFARRTPISHVPDGRNRALLSIAGLACLKRSDPYETEMCQSVSLLVPHRSSASGSPGLEGLNAFHHYQCVAVLRGASHRGGYCLPSIARFREVSPHPRLCQLPSYKDPTRTVGPPRDAFCHAPPPQFVGNRFDFSVAIRHLLAEAHARLR